jgi:flagellin
MSFSIQTNVNSLVAQENLRVNSNFQSQTIQRLTSGYRINSSADDAAGLAVANKFRSDISELTQGVRNANDGVAQLQIIDGGMSNISKMLDRLKTLATQSASDSFMGDRNVLNREYQTLVGEIDRQAQAVGLSTGGQFAKSVGVYIGGGKTASGALDTNNGAITLDLANSVVDSKALGLRTSEYAAASKTGTNLAAGSSTSVANIFTTNGATATFELSGEGYSSTPISITLTAADTTSTVVDKLNAAIQGANNSGTTDANNLRTADIKASVVKDSAGKESIQFASTGGAFQVVSTTATANALMGNFDATSTNAATGASSVQKVNSEVVGAGAAVGYADLKVTVDGATKDLKVALAASDNTAQEYRDAIRASSTYSQLTALGVTAEYDATANKVYFTGNSNQSIRVSAAGDSADTLGFGAWKQGTEVVANNNVVTGQAQTANVTLTIDGSDVAIAATTGGGDGTAAAVLAKLTGDATYAALQAKGVTARLVGNKIAFEGNAGQTIVVKTVGDAANVLGLGVAAPDAGNVTSSNFVRTGTAATLSAGANGNTATVGFSINGGDKILVTFTSDGTLAGATTAFQTAVNNNAELSAAGVTIGASLASVSAGTGVNFRMMVEQQTGTLQLGVGTTSTSSNATFSTTSAASMIAAGGASQTGLGTNNDVFAFRGLTNTGATAGQADSQVVSFNAADSDGVAHSLAVTLTTTNGGDVDSAVTALNAALQGSSSDSTLKKIVAVKETNAAGTAEGIRFISSLDKFAVLAGVSKNTTDTNPVGMYDATAGATAQGVSVGSSASGTIDISSKAGAAQAVVALANAVTSLGQAQGAVGKGQNQLGYAISLAQSQINNFSSAQAQIRDADVAAEAANLTKAQVLQQASIAAMAQANSAPQAVLSLLRG